MAQQVGKHMLQNNQSTQPSKQFHEVCFMKSEINPLQCKNKYAIIPSIPENQLLF